MFVEHMTKTHDLFSDVFYKVFRTEEEGQAYALTGSQRLWALVVFGEGPDPATGVADYTIRMNYTTVPTTWSSVNKWSRGIPVYYKQV